MGQIFMNYTYFNKSWLAIKIIICNIELRQLLNIALHIYNWFACREFL